MDGIIIYLKRLQGAIKKLDLAYIDSASNK